jgi:stearoyl-CoA desaturase (delta-9 desaturase)
LDSFLLFAGLTFVFYLWHMFGVTIGLHRLLSHRAFTCSKAVEYFFVFGAYFAFHGSPVWWATIHRAHHRYSDLPLDPHTPNNGIFSAYAFYSEWKYPAHINPKVQSKDLLKDPLYRLLESGADWKLGYAINVVSSLLFRVVLLVAFGPIVAGASLLAGILALNAPLILNIICHMPRWGYKNFKIKDDSMNNWLMAIICVGDGWHNNHHAVPGSSNMGLKPWEIDPSFLFLKALQAVGLVGTINETLANENPRLAPVPVTAYRSTLKAHRKHKRNRELTSIR